jgi:hypothetical protein
MSDQPTLPPILPLVMCAHPGCRRPAMAGGLYCDPNPIPRRGFIAGHPGGHDFRPAPVETFESDEDAGITTTQSRPRIRRAGDL